MNDLKTVKAAALALGVAPATVYALCASRKLRHVRVGAARKKILIPAAAIEEYLAKGTVENADAPPAPPPQKLKLRHLKL